MLPVLNVKECPLCHKPVELLGPCSGEWIWIAACRTINCPYSVEYHGPGQIIPTTQYERFAKKGNR